MFYFIQEQIHRLRRGVESRSPVCKRMLKDLPLKTKLVVENVPYIKNGIGVSIDQLISIIHKINDVRVGMMLDTGHCYMNENEQFLYECQKAFSYLYGLHINDNHGLSDEHLQIGEGTIPFERLFLDLRGKDLKYVLETDSVERAECSRREIMRILQH